MKMDQHHDYSIDEHNACRIETPPARISSPRPYSALARTVVPLRSAGEGTGSRVIAMLALVAGMSVMVGAHAAECPHGTIITAEDTVCTVPSGTGFVTVELWGAGGGSAAGSRDFGGAGGGGGGAYCSGMVAVDPGNSITLKVGRAGTGSVFQNVDGWEYGDNGGASTVTGPPGLAGFRAAGGKGGRGGKLPAIPLPLTVTLAWGGEGGDAEQCAITDVAINRLRYSGGRGGGTQGQFITELKKKEEAAKNDPKALLECASYAKRHGLTKDQDRILAKILADLYDENGRITIKPFQKKLLESHATLTVVTMLKQWSLPSCTDALVRYNPDEDIILTPYNKAFGTIELNKQIAQFLGERRGALVHEVIAGFQKYYLAIGDKMFYNKEECIITDLVRNDEYMGKIPQPASRNLDRWGNFKEVATEEGYHETAADSDDFDLLNTLSAENIEDRVNAASHVAVLKFGDGTELEISSAAAFNNMLGGYALTVHKSQGSEWRKTYIFLHHTQATMHSRELLYTAVTRTKQELVIICEGDSIEKCVRNARLEGTTLAEKMKLFQGDKLTEYERTMLEKGVLL